ncbi:nSTAND1 domain-containing NTPase [Methylovulum psychrotolerans]|uniref:Novel STAND NTPase 1 domain-containing protein n=1 Tax=Methylovulum psychrotolerans TaxID=1704499 RepID=A0A1Z4BUZ2_9GAMM|nr:ATP-binding protein [Methylovulum psychrotolerans]ASF45134.1 hypothetical protein CEK71_03115 [Methylovulum psychrotolerans]
MVASTQPKARLPGYWELLWLLFMQPMTLHRRLRALGIDKPDALAWRFWRWGGVERAFILRMLVLLVTATPLLTGALVLAFQSRGFVVDYLNVVFGVASGVAVGVALGVAWGVASGVAAGVSYIRLPFYLMEIQAEFLSYFIQRFTGRPTLSWSPVLHHDLIYFPLPFLVSHITLTAETDPSLARRTLDACAIAPGQRRLGRIALARLQARELAQYAQTSRFAEAAELQGDWLPGVEGADPLLSGLAEMARYFQAAQQSEIAYHRLGHLERGEKAFKSLENQLLNTPSFLARELRPILPAWYAALAALRREAEQAAEQQLPNPFRSGNPLEPETGREVFRGRENLVRQVDELLADAGNAASLALLGPRRCGKTSLLKMLPSMLPDAVVVLFDLQDNPVDSLSALFEAMDRQIRIQARRDRQLELPALDRKRLLTAPFETAKDWLDALETAVGERCLLLCIDEFERLEDLFPGERRELLQFMGLLRATIQHKRRVRLLVSGAAPFEEWGELWSDHFINVREIAIGHLDRQTTVGLLTRPIPVFPAEAIPVGVAESIYQRTGGQPYLVQLYGSLLVSRLNETQCRTAELADLEAVERRALEQSAYYFRHLYRTAPESARAALQGLAQGETTSLDPRTRRWLERRLLIDGQGQLNIPVLGRWLVEEEL